MNRSAPTTDSQWFTTATEKHCILFVFAHPDDEGLNCGGAIARYIAAGLNVHLVCGTRGECGAATPELLGNSTIAELRTAELLCAAKTLGLTSVHFLGYRDSGMAGSPDGQHPESLASAPEDEVIGKLVKLIRTLRPQVVVTHGPSGDYGHPDHLRLYATVTAAFAAAGDPARYPEHLTDDDAPWSPQRLYYTTYDARPTRLFIILLRLLRKDPSRFGENGDVDLVASARLVTPVTCAINVRPWLATKVQAFRCHRSQLGPWRFLLQAPAPIRSVFLGSEWYTRAVPQIAPGEPRERGFFPEDRR